MTHIAPAVYTVWSVISVTLVGFLLAHIWKFDRFECLKLTGSRQTGPGAFKRVMTFSYLASVPLLCAYSVGMMIVKYREGYFPVPGHGIIPTPYQLWTPENARLILPLQMILSVAWAFEIVTHTEELCFWLFLITVGPKHTSWFHSLQFKLWVVASVCALTGMPIVTALTRKDPLKCEAYTFLAGSIGSLIITLWSLRVLWVFPSFIRRVKDAGGEPEVVVRLTTFHDLNVTRLVFRFFFVGPTLILAVDGVMSKHHVNEAAVWTDLLTIAAGIGLTVSSAFTLLIFFPRSIEREAGYKPRRQSSRTNTTEGKGSLTRPIEPIASNPFASTGPHVEFPRPTISVGGASGRAVRYLEEDEEDDENVISYRAEHKGADMWEMVTSPTMSKHNPYDSPSNGIDGLPANTSNVNFVTSGTSLRPTRPPRPTLHPMLMNYSSPINTSDSQPPSRRRNRPVNAV